MSRLIHPELSYQVRGILFEVYNALGPMLREEYCGSRRRLARRWLRIIFDGSSACAGRPGLKPQGYGAVPVQTG